MSSNKPMTITVGILKEHLASYPDHYELDFSGLDFYRLKQRGPELVQVEFNQQVYRDGTGRVVVENLE
ncbi:hypothetical protein [Pseudomonas citronellolis]|uniref:hypothetical protein n=1 Tax=Pseudomonas citronellolis TaxID=53408 RepID=UPI002D772606|nr:hypothetical protein [Pseudomonas citronellolis]WRT82756.1 hypothetical protein VK748_30765 [Pseudomonas citronellolis]